MSDEQIPPRAERSEPRSYEKTIAVWTSVLGGSTIALFIATAISAYFLYKTDHTISNQAEINKLQTRAYIGLSKSVITPNVYTLPPKPKADTYLTGADFQVTWKNFGVTPAFDMRYFISVHWFPNHTEPDFSKPALILEDFPPGVLGGLVDLVAGAVHVDSDEIQKVAAGNGRIFVWGIATYRDLFSITPTRATAFCYLLKIPPKLGENPSSLPYKSTCNTSS
jgi:hypothetical protein